MKLFFQLIFFILALVLTFFGIFFMWAIIQDAGSGAIDRWSDEEAVAAFVGGVVCPIIAIVIYFILWKDNFFSRNK